MGHVLRVLNDDMFVSDSILPVAVCCCECKFAVLYYIVLHCIYGMAIFLTINVILRQIFHFCKFIGAW